MQDKIKHLEFIQNIVNRMAKNSFILKGWSITLVSGLVFFSFENGILGFKEYIYLVILFFFLLDMYYLEKEKQYRTLYNRVRMRRKVDFSLEIKYSWREMPIKMFSIPTVCFYILLILMVILINS